MATTIGGLATGLDTNAIIDGLTNIEQSRVAREEKKKKQIEDKQTAYKDLFSRIGSFSSKVDELNDPKKFNLFTTTSDKTDNLTITGGESATPGTYEVEVQKLATSEKVASKSYASIVTTLSLAGSFSISKSAAQLKAEPNKTSSVVTVLATDTLKDIAAKINASESGVTASLLNVADGDARLVLTSKDPGSKAFTLNNVTGNVLGDTGLGLISDQQAMRTNFNFLKQEGGAGEATTTFNQLALSIGSKPITTNDSISFTGKDASGNVKAGSFNITMGGPTPSSLQDLLTAIKTSFDTNADTTVTDNVDVYLNKSGEIVVSDKTNGTAPMTLSLTFNDNDTTGSKLSLGESSVMNTKPNILNEGVRSFYKIDGMAVSSQTNSDDKIALGTTFNLKKAEIGTTIKVSLTRDLDGIKKKVQSFVEEYNSLMKFIKEKTKVDVSAAPKKDPNDPTSAKSVVQSKGALAGESEVGRLRAQIQKIVTDPVDELKSKTQYISLSRIGVVTDPTTGELTTKDDQLTKALQTDFEGVRRLFGPSGWSDNPNHEMGRFTKDTQTGTYKINADTDEIDAFRNDSGASLKAATRVSTIMIAKSGDSNGLSVTAPSGTGSGSFTFVRGISSQIKQFYDRANDYAKGSFKYTREALDRSIKEQDKRVDSMQARTDTYKAALVKQFAALEQSVSRLKSQSSSFLSQLG
jgi:flagellar hook-associated protein 2